ncbi:MAG TPA: hypothetical protein VNU92_05695 [Edaphobacter sp.]|jgi:hypothetical protein|nr:hypothetical protein [Edaphobacter sp.]
MPILIVVLLFVGFTWFLFRFPIKSSSSATTRNLIPEELELNSIRDALIEKQGLSLERAEAARTEYVRFLTLLQKRPGFMLVPWSDKEGRDDLDQFWHQHILDTAKYAADCNALFGKMIHHNPHVVRGSDNERDGVEKTQRLYARTFGSKNDGSAADPVLLASCSACATADSYCSSHGGHGHNGDGGHGSHSCGGHSCGGHGCGHGCGGH